MNIDNVFKTLENSIIYLEIIVYILVFLLIVRAITLMVYNFINYKNMEQKYIVIDYFLCTNECSAMIFNIY